MTHIPLFKNYPKAYLQWIYGLANKDSDREWALREEKMEVPKYREVRIPFTKATAYNFLKSILP